MLISDLYVMIVEPSNVQSRIIRDRLQDYGINTFVEVREGAEALSRMREDAPDLVISAYYLPDISGAELLQQMRADADFNTVAFVLVSSETRFRYLDAVKQGATALLPKPFTDEQLHTALTSTIHNIEPDISGELEDLDLEMLNVLLVDDSVMARNHIRQVLSGLGISRFVEAEDGQDALEKLELDFFDLVVTDYNMPNLDGKELTEYIRQQSSQRSVPVLMVTSSASEPGRLSGVQQAGVSAVCDKPFTPEEIKQLLVNLLT